MILMAHIIQCFLGTKKSNSFIFFFLSQLIHYFCLYNLLHLETLYLEEMDSSYI